MKKTTLRALLSSLAAGLMLLVSAVPASAQTGEKTLGLKGGFATFNDGGYMAAYFQYTIVPHVRIAPEIGYVFRNKGASAFVCSVDCQFPFRMARGFGVYPLIGLTLNNWSHEFGGSTCKVGGNFGGGIEFYLTPQLKLSLQGKYSAMNDTGGGFFDMGIGYVF